MRGIWVLLLGAVLAGAALAQPLPLDEPLPLAEQARALTDQGHKCLQEGRYADALAPLEKALQLYRRLYPPERYPDGHAHLATSLNNLGYLLVLRGDLDRAEPLLVGAVAMYRKVYPVAQFPDGHPALAMGLNNLGILRRDQGDSTQAEAVFREAVAMCEKVYPPEQYPDGHPNLAQTRNNLAAQLQARAEYAQAEELFRRALAMRRRLYSEERYPDGHPYLAVSLNNLGAVLQSRGEPEKAEPFLREAMAMYGKLYPKERFPDGHPHLASTLGNLATVLRAQGQLGAAEECYRDALAICRKLYPPARYPEGHRQLALGLDNIGTALGAQREYARAEPLCREALAMFRKLYPAERYPAGHPDLALSLHNLGFLLLARQKEAEAEALFGEAQAMYRRLLDVFLEGAAEAEALNHLMQLPRTRDHYLTITRGRPDRDEDAYAAVWDSKGAVARLLRRRRQALLLDRAKETRELARELTAARRALARLLLTPADQKAEQPGQVRALGEQKERLEKALAARLPAFAALQDSARRRPAELRQHLPAGTAFIDLVRYFRTALPPAPPGAPRKPATECYVGFVLAQGRSLRRVELGPAEPIDEAVADWRRELRGQVRNAKSEIRNPKSEEPEVVLRRLVWAPLAKQLAPGTHTVYLAPDGALTRLPWAALPADRPGTVVLESCAVAVVPDGPLLLSALRGETGRHQSPDAGTLLLVGGVAYDREAGQPTAAEGLGLSRAARDKSAKVQWHALPGTARELERVRGLAGDRPVLVRQGTAGSTAQLLADLPKARWAHLATHGFFADSGFRSTLRLSEKDFEASWGGERIGPGARSPLVLSGLVCAGANRPVQEPAHEDGGILTAEAIAGLDLDSLELAVLSACDTGLGEVAGGEGVFGLQRAFHLAGAQNVVASLWHVDDEATAALMGLFYHHLWREGQPPLEALRQAQLTLYHHPERIPVLARERGPDFTKAARLPAASGAASARRSPARLWAGFIMSGVGR
jgi:CHAT domain-containing protein/Tfp pilus assembly protein PilF